MPVVKKLDEYRYLLPQRGSMRTEGLVYASDLLIEDILKGNALTQVENVAALPGIVGRSLAMPDIHLGYGFPIGGVAAFDVDGDGVVSPGGVGYDINCGVRLLRSSLDKEDVFTRIADLADLLFDSIPSGVGSRRLKKWSPEEMRMVMIKGARWAVENGMGFERDLVYTEAGGSLPGAKHTEVSIKAIERGKDQIGTLGSGNHFCEVEYVDKIFQPDIARVFGLHENQVVVTIHTGSRGFGYQICDDYLRLMLQAARKYGINLPDRQLCCAPVSSPEAQKYLGAMACAANYAFANRQTITHYVREAFNQIFGDSNSKQTSPLELVYDVAHNIAKMETHHFEGKRQNLCVHRKGATHAYPPDHPETPEAYRNVGQPVLIPGDMGRYSYVLVGTKDGYLETWGSVCHGAGRVLSRHEARKRAGKRDIEKELNQKGILIRAAGKSTVLEEIPEAYKDVANVVDAVEGAGLGKKVARLIPMAVIKG